MSRNDDALGGALARWVALSLRHGTAVTLLMLLLSAGAAVHAWRSLGFNTNPNELFADDLRFQQMIRAFEEHFPQLTDSLLVVVDAETAEAARAGADALVARLRQRQEFTDVYFPGEEAFFEKYGLLYLSVDELDEFAARMAELQPVIGVLSRDPSLASLTRLVRQGLEQRPRDEAQVARLRSVLDHYRNAAISVYAEYPLRVSWETALLGGTPFDPETRRVIVAVPVLHFGRILSAGPAMSALREEAAALARPEVRVRVTGYPALNHEEFLGLARDTGVAGGLSFLLVVAVLAVAFRSGPLVFAAAVTLVCGFAWTAAYAAIIVGELNPASIAFAVLFIGLGVDFTIHLGMHLADAVHDGAAVPEAFDRAVRSTGSALVFCALTTAIGFLAFLPTAYRGVSELGLITAGGMLVIVFQTLTLFPVLVAGTLRPGSLARMRGRRPFRLPLRPPRHAVAVCSAAAALGIAGLWLAPRATLETNVVALRNPETESVQTFMDLVGSNLTPWYADLMAPDLAGARALAERVRALPEVARAITIADYVPEDQEEKREILADVALMLDLPASGGPAAPDVPVQEQVRALRELVRFLSSDALEANDGGLAASGRSLRAQLVGLLARMEGRGDREEAIETLERSLLGSVPELVRRLRASLDAPAIAFEDLPRGLVRRMLADDGTARVQVFPAGDITERAAMVRFVEALREVTPDITGLPVNLVESAYVTNRSLRQALVFALVVIAGLLVALWGRPSETAIALAPLLLAVVLTAACTVIFTFSFNFINVCVLPLLLGIGVDSGVHLVHRARQMPVGSGALLSGTTMQAVLFSALTTLASFGTLVLSDHQGIASLGRLLVVGMGFTLLGNLVLLPALLVLWQRRGGGAGRADS